jgi:glycosyltransferase involved in cell wall biosynthesis
MRQMSSPQLSLVIPTYKPGSALESTWQELNKHIRFQPEPWEVLFVCDGCPEHSPERLTALCQQNHSAWCRVLHYQPNQGKGFAVRTGLLAARGAVRLFTDVDLAYSFADILRVARILQDGARAAIASRDHEESLVEVPLRLLNHFCKLRFRSRVFNFIVRMMLDLPFRDTQAGLKGFSAPVVEEIVPRLACHGFTFDCELLQACVKLAIPVAEVPVRVRCLDTLSTTRTSTMLQMLKDLWRIHQRWKRGMPSSHEPNVQVREVIWQATPLPDVPPVAA